MVLNFRTPGETLLAVKSLLASRRPIDELIVVDNDSSDAGGAGDDIRDALKDVWPRISYIDTGSNLGFSGGMNVGIRHALRRSTAHPARAMTGVRRRTRRRRGVACVGLRAKE